jgi:cytochrome o ubiquinol oxidase operon protein cyoD
LTGENALLAIAGLALVQIVVHLIFFLHLNTSSEQRWNVMAFAFTLLTAVIVIGGTLWVMHNVSMHMMSR